VRSTNHIFNPLIDEEAVYDARQGNDRLLLGLKGSLNEYELDLFRQRSQAARKQKAQRGELGMNLPIGFVNAGDGRIDKDPDQRVRQAIKTMFDKFLELGTARQVLMWFLDQKLELPGREYQYGQWVVVWRRPTYHVILRLLGHPIYAGVYAWGKTHTECVLEGGQVRKISHDKPVEEWLVLQHNHHEGYIDWDTHRRIQMMLQKNRQTCGGMEPGAAKQGMALLSGLLRCRRCGMKLKVRYTGSDNGRVPRYVCHQGYEGNSKNRCISFGGTSAAEAVSREVLRVIEPGAVEAALVAGRQVAEQKNHVCQSLALELQAARYEASRASHQYDAADPENRLVTAELEKRWNIAMSNVHHLEAQVAQQQANQQTERIPSPEYFQNLAQHVAEVWNNPRTDVRIKKRIVRTLIEEVVADVDRQTSELELVIHWRGGVHTTLRLPRRRPGHTRRCLPVDLIEGVRGLACICSDEQIAAWMTRNGIRTPGGNYWTRQHVTGLRHRNDIPVYEAQRQESEGWMNLTQAAKYLDIDRVTLRVALERRRIPAIRPLPVGPWLLRRDDLNTPLAQGVKNRVRQHRQYPRREIPEQLSLGLTSTS